MAAVDAAHVGSASGVNNAVARVAGLLAHGAARLRARRRREGRSLRRRLPCRRRCAACVLALLAGLSAFARGRALQTTPQAGDRSVAIAAEVEGDAAWGAMRGPAGGGASAATRNAGTGRWKPLQDELAARLDGDLAIEQTA